MFGKKRALFYNPDYHTSFLMRDELRKQDWKADIYCPAGYPKILLYSQPDISDEYSSRVTSGFFSKLQKFFCKLKFFFKLAFGYHYFVVYGTPFIYPFIPYFFKKKFIKKIYSFELSILKFFGKKIIYIPSGCRDEALRKNYLKHHPDMCNNCPLALGRCDDAENLMKIQFLQKYGDFIVASAPSPLTRLKKSITKYKCIDLDLWNPNISIPKEFLLPPTKKLRILHSFYNKHRTGSGRNIKGSPFVLGAMDRLKKEGYAVEYVHLDSVQSKDMRFYQVQADIIVEQLIYGWWGSTGVETLSLGKPVVCFLHPEWKKEFFHRFPEYDSLPIVEASTDTIYDALKQLVIDREYRISSGKAARAFAERHFDVKKNTLDFVKMMKKL